MVKFSELISLFNKLYVLRTYSCFFLFRNEKLVIRNGAQNIVQKSSASSNFKENHSTTTHLPPPTIVIKKTTGPPKTFILKDLPGGEKDFMMTESDEELEAYFRRKQLNRPSLKRPWEEKRSIKFSQPIKKDSIENLNRKSFQRTSSIRSFGQDKIIMEF